MCRAVFCASKQVYRAGFCKRHWDQIVKYGKVMRMCGIEDCEGFHYAKGYCRRHYEQYRRYGKVINPDFKSYFKDSCEKVSGCNASHYAKGYCKRHYTQIQRNGKITKI